MLLPAPVDVGWPFRSFQSLETSRGRKTGHLGQPPQPHPCKALVQSAAALLLSARKSNSSLSASGKPAGVASPQPSTALPEAAFPVVFLHCVTPLPTPQGQMTRSGAGHSGRDVCQGGKDECPRQTS